MSDAANIGETRAFLVEGPGRKVVLFGVGFLAAVLAYSAITDDWGIVTLFGASSACVLIVEGILRQRRKEPAGPEQVSRAYAAFFLCYGIAFTAAALLIATDTITAWDGRTFGIASTGVMAALMFLSLLIGSHRTAGGEPPADTNAEDSPQDSESSLAPSSGGSAGMDGGLLHSLFRGTPCPTCGQRFSTARGLERHIEAVHAKRHSRN